MIKINKVTGKASFLVTLAAINSIVGYLTFELGNTTIWLCIQAITLYLFWDIRNLIVSKSSTKSLLVLQYYLIWNAVCILRGVFIAETYWDWKGLMVNSFGIIIPIVAYSSFDISILQSILRSFVKYGLPIFVCVIFLVPPGAYGFYLVPISFLALFFPLLTTRSKWIVFGLSLFVITSDLTARSNVIKFIVPFFLLFIYYGRRSLKIMYIEYLRKLVFVAPLVLFILGVSGIFNVFKMDEYITGDYTETKKDNKGVVIQESLLGDTRTFLYVEVLASANKYNTWIFGRSPARGNETESFLLDSELTGRNERLANEAAILNIFTWTGIVGVILFMMVFYKASELAVRDSHNSFSKVLGVFVAFRWAYAWVEDGNLFNLSSIFLWFVIGLCFSKSFRSMSDLDLKVWVRGVFDKRYITSNYRQKLEVLRAKASLIKLER